MSIGHVRALTILHRAFGTYPAPHRLHLLIRYITCPFLRTIEDVPAGARVLDIGAGHGLYARLVTEERAREVVAVEPDLRKALLPSPSPKIRKVAGFDDAIGGTFECVVVYDVTYRMSAEQRRELFSRAFDRLKPGGTLIFKDMDPSHQLKMKWARFQEWLSDKFLGISIGSGFRYQSREEVEAMLTGIGFSDVRGRSIGFGYPHPHFIYSAKRSA